MPLLPLANCGEITEPDDTGYEWLFETGAAIMAKAWFGLAPFVPPADSPCSPGLFSYISVDAPPAEFHGDILAVYATSIGPSAAAVNQQALLGCLVNYPQLQIEWTVDLWENGYPTIDREGQRVTVPDPDTLHNVNQWVYVHGLAAYNAVIQGTVDGSIDFPSVINNTVVGPLVPLTPEGGVVGWRFRVTNYTTS